MAKNVEHEIIEERDGSEGWLTRFIMSVGGILLLAGALALWQMPGLLGKYEFLVPWLAGAGILLGGAAIIESITAEIWVTIIGGIFVLAASYIIAGRVNVQIDAAAHQAYVVDRFTGQVRICDKMGCQELSGFQTASGVSQNATDAVKAKADAAGQKVQAAAQKLTAPKADAKPAGK